MILVIAEKPSVGAAIGKVLGASSRKDGYLEGNNYIVSWCVGHLVGLADASSYDERFAKWRYSDLPIVPDEWLFEVPKDKQKQFKVLRDLMLDKRVTELVCATDAGREGELIFRLVYKKAGCTKPFKRLWISSLEDNAIREGFANLKPAAKDFRIYWDNAYCVHHLYDINQDHLIEILKECKRAGNPDMVYKFCSTSKITFPGSGVAAIATSANNLEDIKKQLKIQTIGHDKVNQLRHVRFFKDIHGITEHMRKHADSLRPKFEMILDTFERELKGLGAGSWYSPKGGYFITYETLDGCAKNVVAKAKKAGVVMTPAGAPFPYGKDPHDSVIRISPSYPSLEDLTTAIDIFVVCVKLASIEKLLGE